MKHLDFLLRGGEYYMTFGFLLLLIEPVTYPNETASRICLFLLAVCLVLFTASILRFRKNESFINYLQRITPNTIFQALISVTGIIMGYAINSPGTIAFWCLMLSGDIIGIIVPAMKKNRQLYES